MPVRQRSSVEFVNLTGSSSFSEKKGIVEFPKMQLDHFCHECNRKVGVHGDTQQLQGAMLCDFCNSPFVEKLPEATVNNSVENSHSRSSSRSSNRSRSFENDVNDDRPVRQMTIRPTVILTTGSFPLPFFSGNGISSGDAVGSDAELEQIIHRLLMQGGPNNSTKACSEELIESLKQSKREVSEDEVKNGCDCGICKDEFNRNAEVVGLKCGHLFCDGCITPWLKKSNTCPMCRAEIQLESSGDAPVSNP